MLRIHRRDALALLWLGIVGAALPGAATIAQTVRKLRVGKAINPSFTFAGLELAEDISASSLQCTCSQRTGRACTSTKLTTTLGRMTHQRPLNR